MSYRKSLVLSWNILKISQISFSLDLMKNVLIKKKENMLDLLFHGNGDEPYTRYNRDAQLANQDRTEYVGCIKLSTGTPGNNFCSKYQNQLIIH